MPEASVDNAWIESALTVTGYFEDSRDPWGGVSGDFDGMGISLGILQWNIGSGSLQPRVRPIGRARVVALMPHYGETLWDACNADIPAGLALVRGLQNGSRLRPAVVAELKAFCHSDDFKAQQVAAIRKTAQDAFDAAEVYVAADPTYDAVTKALFCWFFDVFTQNGGLKGLTYADVETFINQTGSAAVDDLVCDWLKSRGEDQAGSADAHKNDVAWRDHVPADRLNLFVLSYLRALKAKYKYQADTLNRKGTIVLGIGWVHTEKRDLRAILA